MLTHLKPAFEKMGWEIYTPHRYDYRISFREIAFEMKKLFSEVKMDLVFSTMLNFPFDMYKHIFDTLPEDCPRIWWTIEDPNCFDCFINQAKLYDVVFTSASEMISKYKSSGIKNVDYLTLATNPELHKPLIEEDLQKQIKYTRGNNLYSRKVIDLDFESIFVGNKYSHYKERIIGEKNILEPLAIQDRNFRIFGDENWFRDKLYQKKWFGSSHWGDLDKIYGRSKIILGVNSQRHSPTMSSMRVYEVLGCKKFFLTDWSLSMETIFEDKEHLVISRNPQETIELYDYYLNNEKERNDISEKGYNFVIKNHTYYHRLKKIEFVLKKVGLL